VSYNLIFVVGTKCVTEKEDSFMSIRIVNYCVFLMLLVSIAGCGCVWKAYYEYDQAQLVKKKMRKVDCALKGAKE